MSTPFRICDSTFRKDRAGLIDVDVHYVIPGPVQDGDAEPWETLDSFAGDAAPFGLPLVDRNAAKQGDGDWILVLSYKGLAGEKSNFIEVEWDMARVEDPITTHPKFRKDAIIKLGGKFSQDDPHKFDGWSPMLKDPVSGREVRNPHYGVEHFCNNNPRLRVSYYTREFDREALRNLSKIDTPRVPGDGFNAPEVPGQKGWLKTHVAASLMGNVWKMTVDWELGEWSRYFYAPDPV